METRMLYTLGFTKLLHVYFNITNNGRFVE